jgi:hypothetical protein
MVETGRRWRRGHRRRPIRADSAGRPEEYRPPLCGACPAIGEALLERGRYTCAVHAQAGAEVGRGTFGAAVAKEGSELAQPGGPIGRYAPPERFSGTASYIPLPCMPWSAQRVVGTVLSSCCPKPVIGGAIAVLTTYELVRTLPVRDRSRWNATCIFRSPCRVTTESRPPTYIICSRATFPIRCALIR